METQRRAWAVRPGALGKRVLYWGDAPLISLDRAGKAREAWQAGKPLAAASQRFNLETVEGRDLFADSLVATLNTGEAAGAQYEALRDRLRKQGRRREFLAAASGLLTGCAVTLAGVAAYIGGYLPL